MSQTISIEQVDGMIAEKEREREAIRLKIVAMQELKALFFGNDASGGGQPSGPDKTAEKHSSRSGGDKGARKMNTCAECKKTWPRSRTIQKRACPHCGSDNWQG